MRDVGVTYLDPGVPLHSDASRRGMTTLSGNVRSLVRGRDACFDSVPEQLNLVVQAKLVYQIGLVNFDGAPADA